MIDVAPQKKEEKEFSIYFAVYKHRFSRNSLCSNDLEGTADKFNQS